METLVGETRVAVAGLRARGEAVGSLAALCSYLVTSNTAVEVSSSRLVWSTCWRIRFAELQRARSRKRLVVRLFEASAVATRCVQCCAGSPTCPMLVPKQRGWESVQ